MPRNTLSVVGYVIIGLAVIGLFSQLFTNTAQFFTRIFTALGFGIAIFAVIYFVFFKKKSPSNDMQKYKKAVKQSKAKYQQSNPKQNKQSKPKPQQPRKKKKASRRASHLRVIDGNKSNRKDRASF